MSRALSVALPAALILALSAPSAAQDGACLDITEAMGFAARNAPELGAALARLDAAEADLQEARSLRRPQLSAFGRTASGDSGLTSNRLENQVGVQVSQRLFDFGDARLAREAARGSVDQRSHEVEAQALDNAVRVADAYLTHLQATAMIGVVSERADYFARQQAAVTDLLATGGATRADKAQIDAEIASAEADALELRFEADRAATRIREATGRSAAALCDADRIASIFGTALGPIASIDDAVSAALTDNPTVDARRSAIRSLEASRDRERRNRLPVIDAVGIVSYVQDDARDDWEARDRLGIDVSVPLLTGRSLDARRDRAQAELSLQESALRVTQRDLREEAEIAFRRLVSLQAQLARREAVAASQGAYFDAMSGEFGFGLGTLPDLVEARLRFEEAQLDVIETRFALWREQLDLMRLTGRLPVADAAQPAAHDPSGSSGTAPRP